MIIINKAGGLVYNRDFNNALNKVSVNDLLVLAGTFHGVHAITKSLTPSSLGIPSNQRTGIEVLESSHFRLTCFQTFTGTKFLLFTEPHQPNVDVIIRKMYELYADYVTKNPFYQLEMPIRYDPVKEEEAVKGKDSKSDDGRQLILGDSHRARGPR
ncbi:MAG: hypothetical protein ASARMPREDX12_006904 [Alectoria sarmentosa]|nr:MAG: hypothetical protein ASARMPRED_003762 [Alectoria sarmentosa]CAD6574693.1 MAG: hypothetical protein ASARMPREDX12_006904 [Alectoria sarmentosa]